ncbi:MAG: NADH-quinone oxidoreductase subunit L [Chloroflexi bacterium RBG_13_46_14]|nr:MAG: NADH-quinone oxidoreductase subunit L [Chloroflexi bacterium RBG_13_46_14]
MDIAFWIMAVVGVVAALGVIFLKNVFHTALSLILCLLTVAGIYITLSADFLAGVQILVYVGGISILVILAIMLTREVHRGNLNNKLRIPAFIIVAVFLGIILYAMLNTSWPVTTPPPMEPTTATLADKMLGNNGFILGIEIAGALLLAAVLGAIVLVREK